MRRAGARVRREPRLNGPVGEPHLQMDKMIIRGGAPLRGTVDLSGSKNAALPCLMAALLTDEPVLIHNVPRLRDVRTSIDLLGRLGVAARWAGDHDVELHARALT